MHLLLLYTCYLYSQRNCNDSYSRCLFVRHGDHHETITDQEDQWIRNILNKIETKHKKSRKMSIYAVNLNSNCPAIFEFYCNVKDSDSPLLYNTFITTLYNTFIITLYNTFIAINRVIASMRESLFSLWNCFFSFIMIGVCCLFDGVITHRYTGTNYANVIYILYFLL